MNIEKDKLERIIKESKTYYEVLQKIGSFCEKNKLITLQLKIIEYGINDSHLVRNSPYTKEEFIKIVSECDSIYEVCKKICKPDSYDQYVRFDIRRWKIDISHFKGRAHLALIKDPFNRYKVPLELVFQNKIPLKSTQLKTRLFAEGYKKCECEECGLKEYLGQLIPLELDHVDGNKHNNNIKNLAILCSNCHSQTDTFAGRNKTWKFSDEQIVEAVKLTYNMTSFLAKLGYNPRCDQTASRRFKQKIKELNIDINHWKSSQQPFKENDPWNKQSLEKLLQYGSKVKTWSLLKRLVKEGIKQKQCEICLIKDWNGKELSFSMDHINGDNKDNRLENLRILCFVCHARTPTYAGKNIGKNPKIIKPVKKNIEKQPNPLCQFCNERPVSRKKNKFCSTECMGRSNQIRPSKEELQRLLLDHSKSAISRIFNVSPASVTYWTKDYDPVKNLLTCFCLL